MDALTHAYREKVVTFGDDDGLVGVLTVPATPRPGAPHVVLLNSGIIHRVGANRIHVRFARMLAELGVTTLRFDLSGIGDSARSTLPGSLADVVSRDVTSAFSFLTDEHGASRFLLVGLCSGAYDAFQAALVEPRVAGVVLLDIPGPFQNWLFAVSHVGRWVMRTRSWRSPIKRIMRIAGNIRTASQQRQAQQSGAFVEGIRPRVTREVMEQQLDTLLARSLKMFFVFTPGVPDNYNNRNLFRYSFPRAAAHPDVSFEYLPTSDHTFSTQKARTQITALIRDWVTKFLG